MTNEKIADLQKQSIVVDIKTMVTMALTSMKFDWKYTSDKDVIMFSYWTTWNSRCTGTMIFSDSNVRIIVETPSCKGLKLDFQMLDELEEFCDEFIECDDLSLIKDENEVKIIRKISIEKFGASILGIQVSIYDTLFKYMCVLAQEYETQIIEDAEVIDDLIEDNEEDS